MYFFLLNGLVYRLIGWKNYGLYDYGMVIFVVSRWYFCFGNKYGDING